MVTQAMRCLLHILAISIQASRAAPSVIVCDHIDDFIDQQHLSLTWLPGDV